MHISPVSRMGDDDIIDGTPTALYANECRVGQNLIEFIIDFGQRYEDQAPRYHTRIVTTPFSMKEFVATMLEALEEHRQRMETAGEAGASK